MFEQLQVSNYAILVAEVWGNNDPPPLRIRKQTKGCRAVISTLFIQKSLSAYEVRLKNGLVRKELRKGVERENERERES